MPAVLLTLLMTLAALVPAWVERETVAMGARLHMRISAESEQAAAEAADAVILAVEELESRVSGWRTDSELARLNSSPVGVAEPLSAETFELLVRLRDLAARTQGAFDPAIGAYVDVWDRGGGEGSPTAPGAGALSDARREAGVGCFDLRPSERSVSRECPRAWIDSRGFERGLVLAEVRRVLAERQARAVRVEFGGQVLVSGPPDDASDAVAIADPRREGEIAFSWPGARGAIATRSQPSGPGGPGMGATGVIDPRTGEPVAAWGSVTVRSDDPIEADALSSALLVMGPKNGIRWLAARPDVEAVFLVREPAGLRLCGRTALIEVLVPVAGDVERPDREITPGLVSCR